MIATIVEELLRGAAREYLDRVHARNDFAFDIIAGRTRAAMLSVAYLDGNPLWHS